MTASSRQTLALTEWALQRRYRADPDAGKVKTERVAEAQAEREKTLRLRSLRLAKETAKRESEFTSEGMGRASGALILGRISVPGNEHAASRRRFEQMRALLRP